MKKTVILFTFILSLSFTVKAQWYKLQAYNNPFITDTCFYIGYPIIPEVVGNGVILYGAETGAVIHSGCLNGGGGENIMLSKDDLDICTTGISDGGIGPGNIVTIKSKNDSTHFVIYTNGGVGTYLKYTTDNFTNIASANVTNLNIPTYDFRPVPAAFSNNFIFFAPNTGYYSSTTDTMYMYRINDSLTSIVKLTNTKYIATSKLYFTSDSIGYMLCIYSNDSAKSVLARTADSGKTWTNCFLDSINTITDFCFPTPNIGYLTENNGVIYKTNNAGLTWNKLTGPAINNLNCVSFANDSLGYVGGNAGALYQTNNAGTSWSTVPSGATTNIVALYTFGKVAYFKDNSNNLYKNESPMSVQNINTTNESVIVYPNPSNGKFSVAIKNYKLGITNSIEIYNLLGEQILSQPIKNATFTIDLNTEPSGVYFYNIVGLSGQSAINGKLIITK